MAEARDISNVSGIVLLGNNNQVTDASNTSNSGFQINSSQFLGPVAMNNSPQNDQKAKKSEQNIKPTTEGAGKEETGDFEDVCDSAIRGIRDIDFKKSGIQPAKAFYCNDEIDNCYTMDANPRGYCLLINNVDYTDGSGPRKGSDVDAEGLISVFEQLYFKITYKRNLTGQGMEEWIKKFSEFDHSSCDAAVIIILAHGHIGVIQGVDGEEIEIDDIKRMLNNENCKGLIKKPKLFFIQACMGGKSDHGVERVVQDYVLNQDRVPHVTDMLFSYSTVKNYTANRNETLGSWYVRSLITAFIEKAHSSEISVILNTIDKNVQILSGSKGEKQATTDEKIGWSKSFYFNPGLSKKLRLSRTSN